MTINSYINITGYILVLIGLLLYMLIKKIQPRHDKKLKYIASMIIVVGAVLVLGEMLVEDFLR
ncbi:MAG: hypothetical protein K6G65_05040 [Lachnospiraceae bacterium]|nr:hypothetical protein [Lachnospiraceae bacterium]